MPSHRDPSLRNPLVARYVLGLGATVTGAWLMDMTGSMWPLALGGALSIMCTVPLVTAIWLKRR